VVLAPTRLDPLADRHPPILPAAFRKLDAVAVLAGPLLPAPLHPVGAGAVANDPAEQAAAEDGENDHHDAKDDRQAAEDDKCGEPVRAGVPLTDRTLAAK